MKNSFIRISALVWIFFISTSSVAIGAESKRQKQANAQVYKRVGETELSLFIHTPDGLKPNEGRPAVVFFFGGGWTSGTPEQFRHHCEYLASRGMVAIAADYRVASRHKVKVAQCVADAKSAIRWVRGHAKKLGIDPTRIVAAGGSAGGHLAAATALVPGFDDPADDKSVSAIPDALVLFNPALVLSPVPGDENKRAHLDVSTDRFSERFGTEASALSPAHHIHPGAPPTIIFHGRADTTVPYAGMEFFEKKMKEAKNRCELIGYDDQSHGFFNYGRGDGKFYKETLIQMDKFLVSLGYLTGQPTMKIEGE